MFGPVDGRVIFFFPRFGGLKLACDNVLQVKKSYSRRYSHSSRNASSARTIRSPCPFPPFYLLGLASVVNDAVKHVFHYVG